MKTETQLAIPPAEKIKQLDALAADYGKALATPENPFSSVITLAVAMGQLRELLTPDVMAPVMNLMNSPLGFLTDRTGKANWKGEAKPLYMESEVKDCLIEATLRGFAPVGNEFNIIAGRFYAAKAGLRRKVTQFPGLANFRDTYEIPRIAGEKGATVKCAASWSLAGKEDSIEREFAVKGDNYATSDSYCGKAERKLLHAVFQRISGVNIPEGDVSDIPMADAREVSSAKPSIGGHEKQHEPDAESLTEWRGVVSTEMKENAAKTKSWLVVTVGKNVCNTLDGDLAQQAISRDGKECRVLVRDGKKAGSFELVSLEALNERAKD